jgi:hypothetical protein
VKLAIEHTFADISRADYEALYFDEAFNVALGDALGLGRELVRLDRDRATIVRHVRCEPKREPGSPADRAFGTSRASFVEELEYSLVDHRGRWRTIPNVIPTRVSNTGTLEIVDDGGGARRVVRGEVKVSLFGFGGLVERLVVAEIEKSYANAARFTEEWLARRR